VTEAAPKKEQRRKFQAIRGTRDLLPPDTALWNHVEETAHAVFNTFGFGEIRLPIFEPTELFARAVGGDTDVVSKEMYFLENTLNSTQRLLLGETAFPGFKKSPPEVARILVLSQIFLNQVKEAMESKEMDMAGETIPTVRRLEETREGFCGEVVTG